MTRLVDDVARIVGPSKNIWPAIPEPTNEVESLLVTVKALKETVEILTRQRTTDASAVTVTDLADFTEKLVAYIETL